MWRNLKKLIASEILRPVARHSDHGTNSQVQSHFAFRSHSNAEFEQAILIMSTCLNALSCWCMIG